jgi:2-methylcitrate dehydratase PrpD
MSSSASAIQGTTTDVTARLAQHTAGLRWAALDDEVRQVARQCIMDWLGVAVAGSEDDTSRIVREESCEQGGNPQASIIRGGMSSVLQTALVNGTAGHALDYDDVHYALVGHPTAAVAPAVMAVAERDALSGQDTLTAFVAGVEMACRVGRYMTGGHYESGWHATATIGTLGAAAGAARALGLDAVQTAVALGIAATQASGLKSMFGTMCKPLHAGKAASNGLYAALLAARGFTSRADVLECLQGFADTQSPGPDSEAALRDLDGQAAVRGVLFKYHAACYGTHATIEAMRSLVDSQNLSPERVTAIEVQVKPRYLKMCNIQEPATGLEAKFSLRMTCAMALSRVNTGDPARYDEALCADPALTGLLDRIRVTGNEQLDDCISEVIVSLDDGVVYRVRGDVSEPAADLALQQRRLADKFDTLVAPVLGATTAPELRGLIERLHEQRDVRAIMALTRS